MLIVGSDHGCYRLDGAPHADEATAESVLDSDRVKRLRTFEALEGVFAATASGLYHSPDLESWTDLGVPREATYAVGASPDGDRLYAGTRPAHIYRAELPDQARDLGSLAWRELGGVQDLPSREEWRLPRHENLAQVRDVHVHADAPGRVLAGVEVGGVHVSEDGGETWAERREPGEDGLHDDVHELHPAGPEEWYAATGFGLFRTSDAGASWTRLDESVDQRYFRAVYDHDGTVYASGALAHSATWDDEDAEPGLFVCEDGATLERVDHPRPAETVTGLTAADGRVVAGTHRGTLLVEDEGWRVGGSFPTAPDTTGRYTPLAWV